MTSIYLIRHGQAGPRQRYDELSALGREQARRLGEHLASRRLRFDAVVSGTLNRQRETALAIADSYARVDHPLPEVSFNPQWDEFDWSGIYDEMSSLLARDDPRFREEFERLHRFGDVVVEARIERPGAIFDACVRGQRHCRNSSAVGRRAAPQLLDERVAVHFRHADVGHDDVRLECRDPLERRRG